MTHGLRIFNAVLAGMNVYVAHQFDSSYSWGIATMLALFAVLPDAPKNER